MINERIDPDHFNVNFVFDQNYTSKELHKLHRLLHSNHKNIINKQEYSVAIPAEGTEKMEDRVYNILRCFSEKKIAKLHCHEHHFFKEHEKPCDNYICQLTVELPKTMSKIQLGYFPANFYMI